MKLLGFLVFVILIVSILNCIGYLLAHFFLEADTNKVKDNKNYLDNKDQ